MTYWKPNLFSKIKRYNNKKISNKSKQLVKKKYQNNNNKINLQSKHKQ